MDIPVFTTAYLPPVHYFRELIKHDKVFIEVQDTYNKQSYRNRCEVFGANGKQVLAIPVKKPHGSRTKSKDVKPDYDTGWQKNHWKSISSAYRSSAYFEFFEDSIRPFYEKKYTWLVDFNAGMLSAVLEILEVNIAIVHTSKYVHHYQKPHLDFREAFHPKPQYARAASQTPIPPYHQVFSGKHGFIPGLSILDLVMNEGLQTLEVLM